MVYHRAAPDAAAGIVAQDIYPTELFHSRLGHPGDFALIGHVDLDRDRSAAQVSDGRGNPLELFHLAEFRIRVLSYRAAIVSRHDMRTFARQTHRDRPANSPVACTSGNYRHLVLQSHNLELPTVCLPHRVAACHPNLAPHSSRRYVSRSPPGWK